MALASGLAAQLGFAAETTWGTPVTVTKFIPLVSESITKDVARIESSGILAGRRVLSTNQYTGADVTVSGDINMELPLQGVETLWKWALGSCTTTSTGGTAPFTHLLVPGDLSDDHLTVQVGRPDTGGSVDAFTYSGMKCASWELAAKAGELVTVSFSTVGKDEATNTALASASFTNGVDQSFTYVNGSISIGGSSVSVKEFTLRGDNGLDVDRRFIGPRTISEPLEAARREYTADLLLEWEGMTQYNRFIAGTSHALTATFAAGSDAAFAVIANVRFDGTTPNVQGMEILEQPVPVKCVGGTDDVALSVAITSRGATA